MRHVEENADGWGQAPLHRGRACLYTRRRVRNHSRDPRLTLASLRSRLRGLAGVSALPVLVFHRLGWTAPVHVARLAWRHIRTERQRLYELPFAAQWSSQAVLSDAIRWMNPASITGGRRTSLFAHPDSRVEWRTTLPPHARVAAWCALLPNVWNSNSGGVRFTITVSAADGRRLGQRSLVARPSVVKTDCRWRRLAVRAGNRLPQDVRITFETSLPDGASAAHAWSVWGDPQIERNRSLPAMTRFLRGELKERGVVGAFTGLRIDLSATARTRRGMSAGSRATRPTLPPSSRWPRASPRSRPRPDSACSSRSTTPNRAG